ncbi:VWA domain-containing protein [Nocardioides donggukensis]|uniref:VWA domain-containing protein n=1 Tax=Nocardioides donggukensis TaxID=2774019 RepID=A0A927K492_9ACTN|nr:VWA domain-containing protein [Nocardioides donggukensis]MBD8868760.1 VWA domain-containing protein [Nocardioides donggukensis]
MVAQAVLIGTVPAAPTARAAEEGAAEQSLLLVLDSSGSMKEPAGGGRTRFAAATRALDSVIGELPGDLAVGLRVYGATIADGPGSCRDSELVVPVGPVDGRSLRAAVDRAEPTGNTPLAYSLEQSVGDLPEEGQRTIVLVSDGEESCGGDPCAVARDLSQQGLDVRVDVVGFQVDGAARDQLTCIAQAGRGTYYDAPDAAALTNQLERLSARTARDYRAAGTPIEGAPTAEGAPSIEQGQYLDTIGDGDEVETYAIDVPEGATLHAAATIRPTTPGLTDTESLELLVTGPGSTAACARERGTSQGAFEVLSPVSATVLVEPEDLEACGPGPYVITVERGSGKGVKPLEVVVVVEPAVTDAGSLPPPATERDARGRPSAAGGAEQVVGAPSYSAAPVLEPGVYRDTILTGETLIYAAELDWGQQLACEVTYGRSPAVDEALDFSEPPVWLKLYSPTRGEIRGDPTANVRYRGDRAVSERATSVPVRHANRDADEPAYRTASIPGTYYCATYLGARPDTGGGEIPLTVTVDVLGEPTGAPAYDAGSAPSESASATPETGESGESGESGDAAPASDSTGLLPWALVALALFVVGGAVVLVRARRS